MDKFTFSYPTRVYFGNGAVAEALGKELPAYGSTVMLAYGGGSIKRNGIYDEVAGRLKNAGKEIVEFGGIMPNPTYDKVQEGAKLARDRHVDLILAVGGGSVMDCSKAVAAQALLDEDLWALEYEKYAMPQKGIPIGAIVTVSGTGSEMNGGAVITYEQKKWKGGLFGIAPVFAVLDPQNTATVPRMQVLSGAFDTLSHAMETYFGKSDKDNVSDYLCLAVMRNTVDNMRRVVADLNDMDARSNLLWDSSMAENGVLKCGRKTDFEAHQIEHQLGAYTDCNHGLGLAVIQPVYYRHVCKDAPEKFSAFGKVVFDVDGPDEAVDALEAFVKECGLPTKLGELRSTVEVTPELLREVADSANIVKTGPRELTHDEIFEILKECM